MSEENKYTISTAKLPSPSIYMKPNYTMTFSNDDGLLGTLDFNGPQMMFTGNAEESAKVFFDFVAKSFYGRLKQERDEALDQARTCAESIKKMELK